MISDGLPQIELEFACLSYNILYQAYSEQILLNNKTFQPSLTSGKDLSIMTDASPGHIRAM